MKKEMILVLILALIIVLLLGILLIPRSTLKKTDSQNNNQPAQTQGITVTAPAPSQNIVSFPLTVTGHTDGQGWNGFEGQVGTVHLVDASNNELAVGILTAITDWMQPTVQFSATVNYTGAYTGNATLVFKNENPSGDPAKDKQFSLPIVIQ